MVSSFSIFFLTVFYFYFKQHCKKLISGKVNNPVEKERLNKHVKNKLMIFPAGIVAVIVIYIISYFLMNKYPEVDNVQSSTRIVIVIAAIMCVIIFSIDMLPVDERLMAKKKLSQTANPNKTDF